MRNTSYLKSLALCAAFSLFAMAARAEEFNISGGDLRGALKAYTAQTGVTLMVSDMAIRGVRTGGVKGNLSQDDALVQLLSGTGFKIHRGDGVIAVIRSDAQAYDPALVNLAAAPAPSISGAALETVTVTSSKIGGDVQNIPIAITALSQEQLTSRQIAGGPDLVKEVPNLTFSKTNFTGYNIQIRGIGTQAISVTTDPAVAVAFNDIPFIRNHFFEQEFYDLSQAEVLRGPQGTLYGRNATAGVVNLVSAKPTDQFEAMFSADIGNYNNRRFEGMVNVPIVDDRFDLRVAGEWTKRDGYSFNSLTNAPIDGRDLWSGRATAGWHPSEKLQAYLVWEHFQEGDDRLRSSKQLCHTDPGPSEVLGVPIDGVGSHFGIADVLSQGCKPASLYSPESYEVPNGQSLPYFEALKILGWATDIDPYASTTQSPNLRVIESTLNPAYKARNDVIELNVDYNVTSALTFTTQTGFNHDFLYSTEDYSRFNTAPGVFQYRGPAEPYPGDSGSAQIIPVRGQVDQAGVFCDPQLGCSDRLVGEDLSDERAWQLSQEFRLTSNFNGPFNFSIGANYMHYETEENYYVFINALSLIASTVNSTHLPAYVGGVSDNHECLGGFFLPDPTSSRYTTPLGCGYIDTNPIDRVNNDGHNYFLSQNPYTLNSYAGFGEVYYNLTDDLKLTGGLRWTEDRKHFVLIPSELLVAAWGYPQTGVIDQSWGKFTGRFAANWSPKLDFTDQTLLYASYAHGYKAGGANPPGAVLLTQNSADISNPAHPLTFAPEFIDAFELGSKNTLADGRLTLNGNVFYYDYKGYQISQIVDRTSVNLNFNATVKGAELETTWEPSPGLKFTFAGGYEDTAIAKGSQAIDLMDRTAGNPAWLVVKPNITQASNCILPAYVVAAEPQAVANFDPGNGHGIFSECNIAYDLHVDPLTGLPYVANPTQQNDSIVAFGIPPGYVGFDPVSPNATNNGAGPVPNDGAGFYKNLSGKELPNAPHFTTSLSVEYTMPVSQTWAATLHSDFYWQSNSFARVFNDRPYDEIRGYSNVNLALIVTSANGWQVLGYLKNIFDTTAITGDFLNSDDSGLTTNVFTTDPRLFGVRVTKNF